jgi:hypothetical protein
MTRTEADPAIAFRGQLQVGAQCRDTHREQHGTPRLHSGLQPSHRTGTEPTDALPDHDDIEPIDHRGQHVDPQWLTGDHDQSFESHPHVGSSTNAEFGKPGNTDPCPLA